MDRVRILRKYLGVNRREEEELEDMDLGG